MTGRLFKVPAQIATCASSARCRRCCSNPPSVPMARLCNGNGSSGARLAVCSVRANDGTHCTRRVDTVEAGCCSDGLRSLWLPSQTLAESRSNMRALHNKRSREIYAAEHGQRALSQMLGRQVCWLSVAHSVDCALLRPLDPHISTRGGAAQRQRQRCSNWAVWAPSSERGRLRHRQPCATSQDCVRLQQSHHGLAIAVRE